MCIRDRFVMEHRPAVAGVPQQDRAQHQQRQQHATPWLSLIHISLYQFDSKIAKHWFCKHCGIHPFSNPRAAPEMYSVNVRCLDDFDLEAAELEIRQFDGRNWEEAIKTLKLD